MTRVFKTDGGIMQLEPGDLRELEQLGATFAEVDCPTEQSLVDTCREATGLLVVREPITPWVLDRLPHCRVITRFGVGLDSVDVGAATARGIKVTYVPDANVHEVATHAVAMILALVRRLKQFDRVVARGGWGFVEPGRGMRRADRLVVGVVGLGRIGSAVAKAVDALGFTVLATDPLVSDGVLEGHDIRRVGLDELLTSSDVVTLHIPLSPDTHHMIDADVMARMKDGAMVVNVSRGGLIDEDALTRALRSGRLSGAALDAFEQEPLDAASPLRQLDNALTSPHAAHYSREAHRETIEKAFADMARVLRGDEPRYPVN